VNSNYKFELRPYSVNFIANSDYLLGQDYLESNYDLRIYPNPFNEFININKEFDYLKLFDIRGNLVLKSSDKNLDTKFLKEGVYILKLYSSSSSFQVKVMKIKK
jgi:hypothetical protein